MIFNKQPTSSYDPEFVLDYSNSETLYTSIVSFDEAIDFDSEIGQEITLFGNDYVVGDNTNSVELILEKAGDKFNITTNGEVYKNEDKLEGVSVSWDGPRSTNYIRFNVGAPNSSSDGLRLNYWNRNKKIDPVFETFELVFDSLSIPEDRTDREWIEIETVGDDKMTVEFTDWNDDETTIQWVINNTQGDSAVYLQVDSDGHNLSVFEGEFLKRNDYVVVGNEDYGRLLKVSSIVNQTSGYSNDKVKFRDVFSGTTYEATLTNDGVGTVTVGGRVYGVRYKGLSSQSEDARVVWLDYPDSSAADSRIVYPTIETSKGALIMFYEPVRFDSAGDWLNTLMIPDGDGYTDLTGLPSIPPVSGGVAKSYDVGKLSYNVVRTLDSTGIQDFTTIYLQDNRNGIVPIDIINPAIVLIEEGDSEAVIITVEGGGNADDGIGVMEAIRTWEDDSQDWEKTLASDSKKQKEADKYGTIITIDSTDSDQKEAVISYPDESVYGTFKFVDTSFSSVAVCGNNDCESDLGETCSNCPGDCGSCSSSSGSPGSSGGSTTSYTYTISSSQIQLGYTKQLRENDRLRFTRQEGGSSVTHYVKIIDLQSSGNRVDIRITSNEINSSLNVGQTKKYDIDSDGYYDLSIKFERIVSNKAELTLKEINEQVSSSSTSSTSSSGSGNDGSTDGDNLLGITEEDEKNIVIPILIGFLVIVVIVIIILLILFLRKGVKKSPFVVENKV
ncbi:MAG: hypothetical protein KKF56_02340 [Nanoarchaeota archaeon]|nr:hypothetical protein [Nanoarchaeota archaeon]